MTERKDRIDAFGYSALTGFALFLALNQIIIKLVNAGLQPVFFAGLRSAIALVCLYLWLKFRRQSPWLGEGHLFWGVLAGFFFAAEFIFMFLALDLTTVTRVAVLLYSMPIWMALGAHVLIPGEALTGKKLAGLLLAFAGVVIALIDRGQAAGATSGVRGLAGDVMALIAAMCWAGIALVAHGTPLREVRPEVQLFWQVLVSAPVLLGASLFFGPLIRDFQLWHLAGLAYQGILVASAGFVFWLWLLSVYPASGVASFSFLTPVFGVALGWLLLDEHVGPSLLLALVLVAVGIVLINRPKRSPA